MVEDATGEVVVYDWQFASVGNGAYDLAYFSALVADPDDRRRLDPELRRAYVSGLAGSGAPVPRDLEHNFVVGASSRSRPSSWVRLLPATTRPRSRRTAGGFGASRRRRWTGAPRCVDVALYIEVYFKFSRIWFVCFLSRD